MFIVFSAFAMKDVHLADACRLVSDDILRLVHGAARMVYVGKQAGFHTRTQVLF